jgi:superfamily II DNA or RNA helicase
MKTEQLLNKQKEKHQLACAEAWINNGQIGTFEMATGVGKNFAALQCLIAYIKKEKWHNKDALEVLILAEVQDREKDFFADVRKFDSIYKTDLFHFVDWTFACYQSAYKWENKHFEIVIADEIHDSLTMSYSEFYRKNNYGALIGLSATVDRKRVVNELAVEETKAKPITKGELLDDICPVIYTLNQDDAIEQGLIAPYELVVLYHQLDDKNATMLAGTKAKPFMTTEKKAYDFTDSRFKKSLFLPQAAGRKFQISLWSRKRAGILYDLPSKIPVFKALEALPDRKIIFGNSLDALLQISDNVVSSRNTEKKNELIRSKFEKSKINTICSFKKLKQGANLPDIKLALVHSYYSVEKDYIQRLGRVLRLDGTKTAKAVFIVTIGTKEQDWFDNMTANIKGVIRGFHKIDDLVKYLKQE